MQKLLLGPHDQKTTAALHPTARGDGGREEQQAAGEPSSRAGSN